MVWDRFCGGVPPSLERPFNSASLSHSFWFRDIPAIPRVIQIEGVIDGHAVAAPACDQDKHPVGVWGGLQLSHKLGVCLTGPRGFWQPSSVGVL